MDITVSYIFRILHRAPFSPSAPRNPASMPSAALLDKSLSPRLLLTLLARCRAYETMTAEKDSGHRNRNASKFSGASCLAAYNTPHHFSRSLTPVAGSWGKCRNGECQIEPSTRIWFSPHAYNTSARHDLSVPQHNNHAPTYRRLLPDYERASR